MHVLPRVCRARARQRVPELRRRFHAETGPAEHELEGRERPRDASPVDDSPSPTGRRRSAPAIRAADRRDRAAHAVMVANSSRFHLGNWAKLRTYVRVRASGQPAAACGYSRGPPSGAAGSRARSSSSIALIDARAGGPTRSWVRRAAARRCHSASVTRCRRIAIELSVRREVLIAADAQTPGANAPRPI